MHLDSIGVIETIQKLQHEMMNPHLKAGEILTRQDTEQGLLKDDIPILV